MYRLGVIRCWHCHFFKPVVNLEDGFKINFHARQSEDEEYKCDRRGLVFELVFNTIQKS